MAESTLYRWKRQDRVDQGLEPGTSSCENAELQAARRRIKELEAELAAVKRGVGAVRRGPGDAPKRPVCDHRGLGG